MKLWRWEEGRQNGGYKKLTLAFSKRLKFDCYIIVLPKGASAPWHRDPSPEGFEHHRFNLTLRKPRLGGVTNIDYHVEQGSTLSPSYYTPGRWYTFRPDAYRHCVSEVIAGSLVLFSFGWLRKSAK